MITKKIATAFLFLIVIGLIVVLISCQDQTKAQAVIPVFRMQLVERHIESSDRWVAIYRDSKTGTEIAVFYAESEGRPSLTSTPLYQTHPILH